MINAIRIHETGGPEVMRWESIEVGEPGPGEVLVCNIAIGVLSVRPRQYAQPFLMEKFKNGHLIKYRHRRFQRIV